jgi:hypothetical protein
MRLVPWLVTGELVNDADADWGTGRIVTCEK